MALAALALVLFGAYDSYPFFKIDLCSATSMKSSRRVLSIYMAEHRSIFKYNQNTHYFLIFNVAGLQMRTNNLVYTPNLSVALKSKTLLKAGLNLTCFLLHYNGIK